MPSIPTKPITHDKLLRLSPIDIYRRAYSPFHKYPSSTLVSLLYPLVSLLYPSYLSFTPRAPPPPLEPLLHPSCPSSTPSCPSSTPSCPSSTPSCPSSALVPLLYPLVYLLYPPRAPPLPPRIYPLPPCTPSTPSCPSSTLRSRVRSPDASETSIGL